VIRVEGRSCFGEHVGFDCAIPRIRHPEFGRKQDEFFVFDCRDTRVFFRRESRRLRYHAARKIAIMLGELSFDGHGDAHAASDAEAGDSATCVGVLHCVEEGDKDAGAARTDGMAQCDGSAPWVDSRGIEVE
jgi:hypothetical protein